jgi:hypothetical protein
MIPKTSTLVFASTLSWILTMMLVPRSPKRLQAARHAARRRRQLRQSEANAALVRAELDKGPIIDLAGAVRWTFLGLYAQWDRWPVREVLEELPDLRNTDPETERDLLPAPYPLLPQRDTAPIMILLWHWLRLVLYRSRWG